MMMKLLYILQEQSPCQPLEYSWSALQIFLDQAESSCQPSCTYTISTANTAASTIKTPESSWIWKLAIRTLNLPVHHNHPIECGFLNCHLTHQIFQTVTKRVKACKEIKFGSLLNFTEKWEHNLSSIFSNRILSTNNCGSSSYSLISSVFFVSFLGFKCCFFENNLSIL